jgi:hypothetical protein
MVPGLDDAKTTEMRTRLDDRLGLWAVTYLLFFVKLGPGLALFLVLVFAIWIGWRMAVPEMPRGRLGRVLARHAPNCASPNRALRSISCSCAGAADSRRAVMLARQ